MAPFLSLEHIDQQFGGVRALDDVSLEIHRGQVHCLAGENGSGKSTLIKVISGINHPNRGRIRIGDDEFPYLTPVDAIRRGIQVIYQDLSLFPNLSVGENLALNDLIERRSCWVRRGQLRQQARHALDTLGVEMDLDQPVDELPVARRQLVAIARSLLQNAKLIVMDEPTAALTGAEVKILLEIVETLRGRGMAILFVSHKLHELGAIADRLTILRNGRVVAHGPASGFNEQSIAEHMTGRRIQPLPPRLLAPPSGTPLLEIRNLNSPMLRDIALDLHPGEIVGLTGLLGAGQSDLAKTLFGLLPVSSGSVRIRGKRTLIRSPQDAMAAGIAYVPEDRLVEGLFLSQSVELNTIAAHLTPLQNRLGLIQRAATTQHVLHWLKTLNIRSSARCMPVHTLSGGNQQRVLLARWLATHPDILILNNPTVGVDIGSKEGLHRKLHELADNGMGILLVSDDLTELTQNCGRVLPFRGGRIVGEFSANDAAALTEEMRALE